MKTSPRPEKYLFLILSLIQICLIPACSPVPETGREIDPAARRRDRIDRGINISFWFTHLPPDREDHRGYFTPDDILDLKKLGFNAVRVPVDPELLLNRDDPARLDPDELALLEAALSMLLEHDLMVIVDIHPRKAFKEKLARDAAFLEEFVVFWRYLARHLRQQDPESVLLEPLNEPLFDTSGEWENFQNRLIRVIREEAPEHTILVTANRGSPIEGLPELSPVNDPNVIYQFHFYDPLVFTHQGADWGPEFWLDLENIPYPPPDPRIWAGQVLPGPVRWFTRRQVNEYLRSDWGRDRIERVIAEAANWARTNQVKVICTEFGAYRPFAPPADRIRWIKDVRSSLENAGIKWFFWDYCTEFGLFQGSPGERTLDRETGRALGLPSRAGD